MKFIKKFNEELNSRTYYSAARKLELQGKNSKNTEFNKRASALRLHSQTLLWERNIKDFSKYGKVKITTNHLSGTFYLLFDFDYSGFHEMVGDYLADDTLSIHFSVGLIPADIETRDECLLKMPDPEFDNGFFWGFWVGLDFADKGDNLQIDTISLSDYDDNVSGRITFNRALSGMIKKHLTACFDDSGYKQDDKTMYSVIEDEVLVKAGVSSHFGITMDELQELIKKITPNAIMASTL